MRSALLVLISLFFLISCKDQTPKGILSESKMQELLVDVHILDGKLAHMPLDSTRPRIDGYYSELFAYHNIDSAQFINSLKYYTARPQTLKGIYENINDKLQAYLKEQQERFVEDYEKQRVQDSIMHARFRDSLARVENIQIKNRLLRDILFVHSADTTKDEPIPFTFSRYGKYVFNEIGLGKLPYSLPDSLYDSKLEIVYEPIKNDLWKNTEDPELKPINFEQPSQNDALNRQNEGNRSVVDPNLKNRNTLIRPQTQY